MTSQVSRQPDQTTQLDLHPIDTDHRDACALICAVRKGGQATHGNVKRTIEALARMGHRTGYINGEGDGVGILTDIPRQLWSQWLTEAGLIGSLATDRNFWVAHVMIPRTNETDSDAIMETVVHEISATGLHILLDRRGEVKSRVLGPNAEQNEPIFWQIAGINGQIPADELEAILFELRTRLEADLDIHFASFSSTSVVYKVQGTIEILRRYYPELRDPSYASTVTMGHARYSTNTNPIFERAQPFALLGHNGEFNTISRFRTEARMLGIPLQKGGSDSQDVDRVLHALVTRFGFDLVEAMEFVFPPYEHDLIQNNPDIIAMYEEMRQAWGHFAQGPAAVATRFGNQLVFSVDALGLRPLWFGETEKEYFASSERGVYPLDAMARSPRPMAPGEKIALSLVPGRGVEVMDYPTIQRHIHRRHSQRNPVMPKGPNWSVLSQPPAYPPSTNGTGNLHQPQADPITAGVAAGMTPQPQMQATEVYAPVAQAYPWQNPDLSINAAIMSGMGWERYHVNWVKAMVDSAKEQIGSLGWDGPLAAMSQTRTNIADYFKETVAVVTNPAIDREREQAQFSTKMVLGARPGLGKSLTNEYKLVQLESPFLLGGLAALGSPELMTEIAEEHGTLTLEALLDIFGEQALVLPMCAHPNEPTNVAIARLQQTAIDAVRDGVQLLLLDDSDVLDGNMHWLDPLLVTSALDKALREAPDQPNLRRLTGIAVRSGALRDLHDMALCVSLGANAILPYAVYATALGIAPKGSRYQPTDDDIRHQINTALSILTKGLQKVISTIGCHELRGYGHSFSSIGLSSEVAAIFGTPNYFGSSERGLTWDNLRKDADERAKEFSGEARARLKNPDRFYPKMWKKAENVAQGNLSWDDYTDEVQALEARIPVSLRHIMKIKDEDSSVTPEQVDLRVGNHSMPVLISAMSYGSQGELAYRTYAEAAKQLDIICMNGEGGELPDMLGQYKQWRGQQVASGRFGVNIGFLNSADFIEIKIGQGAKPGEGGHLPGFKVTEKVAASRHTTPGVALISPSNNHDLYSIEDLAQLIDELKTANPHARVSVKIPVVPGVGIIAVGVAKAGADIITVTGYTGGTGAARAHALRHVGLPAEIGVWLSHRALLDSGLRKEVELWVDGGMKSGRDVVKMMCLGANRVGFGTLAMVAVGCTICRGCQDGTCHVGITTHVTTREEAEAKDFKAFRPFHEKGSPQGIVNMFCALGEDIKKWTAKLGFTNPQQLVGRADLLEQSDLFDRINLNSLLTPAPVAEAPRAQSGGLRVARPRNIISRQITEVVSHYIARGEYELTYDDEQVMAMDRALGTHLCGALKRNEVPQSDEIEAIHLSFSNSAVPGNGMGAFLDNPVTILAEGGAQDGVGKGAYGGTISVLKGLNHNGARLDGSVGKSFAYGAQGGLFVVQGNADTRACIRMSGASVVFGGEIRDPLRDELGGMGARANLKGYAFEYMTSGRALVLGDPGPWMCSGMTGGVVYQRIQPEMNLTLEAIQRRIAAGSPVQIYALDDVGVADVEELLKHYFQVLTENHQVEAADKLRHLLENPQQHFVKIAPPLPEMA